MTPAPSWAMLGPRTTVLQCWLPITSSSVDASPHAICEALANDIAMNHGLLLFHSLSLGRRPGLFVTRPEASLQSATSLSNLSAGVLELLLNAALELPLRWQAGLKPADMYLPDRAYFCEQYSTCFASTYDTLSRHHSRSSAHHQVPLLL